MSDLPPAVDQDLNLPPDLDQEFDALLADNSLSKQTCQNQGGGQDAPIVVPLSCSEEQRLLEQDISGKANGDTQRKNQQSEECTQSIASFENAALSSKDSDSQPSETNSALGGKGEHIEWTEQYVVEENTDEQLNPYVVETVEDDHHDGASDILQDLGEQYVVEETTDEQLNPYVVEPLEDDHRGASGIIQDLASELSDDTKACSCASCGKLRIGEGVCDFCNTPDLPDKLKAVAEPKFTADESNLRSVHTYESIPEPTRKTDSISFGPSRTARQDNPATSPRHYSTTLPIFHQQRPSLNQSEAARPARPDASSRHYSINIPRSHDYEQVINGNQSSDQTIVLEFHVALSTSFISGRDKVFIQPDDLTSLTQLKENGNLMRGSFQLIPTNSNGNQAGKYVRFIGRCKVRKRDVIGRVWHYAYVVEIQGRKTVEWIDSEDGSRDAFRCLTIPYDYQQDVWKQYDWPITEKPKRMVKLGGDIISEFIPRWEGFCVHVLSTHMFRRPSKGRHVDVDITPGDALVEVEQIWRCIANARIQKPRNMTESWTHGGFNFKKMMLNCVSSKIDTYSKTRPCLEQIQSALGICYLSDPNRTPLTMAHHDTCGENGDITLLELSEGEQVKMWKGLCIPHTSTTERNQERTNSTTMSREEYGSLLHALKKSFGEHFAKIQKSLENQCRKAVHDSLKNAKHSWLYALPLLHLLRGDIKPYASPALLQEDNHQDPSWWGLGGLGLEEDQSLLIADGSMFSSASAPICHIMQNTLSHLCEVDQLLPCSFMWLLRTLKGPQEILGTFREHTPKEIALDPYVSLCALFGVISKMEQMTQNQLQDSKKWNFRNIQRDIVQLIDTIETNGTNHINQIRLPKFLGMCSSIALSMFHICSLKQYDVVIETVRLLTTCFNSSKWRETNVTLPIAELIEWLKWNLPENYMGCKDISPTFKDEAAKIWGRLITLELPERLQKDWCAALVELFKERVNDTLTNRSKVLLSVYKTGSQELDDTHHKIALQAITEIVEDPGRTGLKQNEFKTFGTLLSEMFESSYQAIYGDASMGVVESFQTLMNMKLLKVFFNFSDEERHRALHASTNRQLDSIIGIFQNKAFELVSGDISLPDLKVIVETSESSAQFVDLYNCRAINKIHQLSDGSEEKMDSQKMEKLLAVRQKEYRTIKDVEENIRVFVQKCGSLQAITVDLTALRAITTEADVKMTNFCTPATCSNLPKKVEQYNPEVRVAQQGVTQADIDSVSFHAQLQSHVFEVACLRTLQGLRRKRQIYTVNQVVADIWKPAIQEWQQVKAKFEDDSITCNDVDVHLQGLEVNGLLVELAKLCVNEKKAKQKEEQIIKYNEIRQRRRSAEALLGVVGALDLSFSSFSDVSRLVTMTDLANKPLSKIKDCKIAKTAGKVPNFEVAQLECLEQLCNAKQFVKWIRANFTGGNRNRNQLRNFIDIVTASGVDDIQLAAIASFRQAVDGYAPLILDLEKKASLVGVVEACKKVWQNLSGDPGFPTALHQANKESNWLQHIIRENQETVESAALHQVEEINSKGVYLLDVDKRMDATSGVKMVVRSSYNTQHDKTYSLSDLQDLNSKLMLLSGQCVEGKEHIIQEFGDVLTAVHQVEELRSDLCSEGCLFFQEWRAEVHCNPQPNLSVIITVTGNESVATDEPVVVALTSVIRLLQRCLVEWNQYVDGKRREFKNLNYFTMTQLMKIRQDLAHLKTTGGECETLALLKMINSRSLSHKLGVSRNRQLWSITPLAFGVHTPARNIMAQLESLWRSYLGGIEESEIGNSFSVHQLGQILNTLQGDAHLDKMDVMYPNQLESLSIAKMYNREFQFQENAPHLFLCDAADIYINVIKLYMSGGQKPLPTADEVILCSPQTSLQEIDLLLRRCLYDDRGGIYCLVNPGHLEHKISVGATECLSNMIRSATGKKYRLAIFSSKEHQTTSHLVAAMSRYQRDTGQIHHLGDKTQIQQYFVKQFQGDSESRVQVVYSDRAGVGKSEEIRHRAQRHKSCVIVLPLHEKHVDIDAIVNSLWSHINRRGQNTKSHIVHLDVSTLVQEGLDDLLFKLLILGRITDSNGRVWSRCHQDRYFIEVTKFALHGTADDGPDPFYYLLPAFKCNPPQFLEQRGGYIPPSVTALLKQEDIQWAFQYLNCLHKEDNLDQFSYGPQRRKPTDHVVIGRLLQNLSRCGVPNPSWTVVRHFAAFLKVQMQSCEKSVYCDTKLTELNGFKEFVIKFMKRMAEDFATPSLYMSEQRRQQNENELAQFELQRKWEARPQPYIFFNEGDGTMTFWSVVLNQDGSLVNPKQPNTVIERNIMSKVLLQRLQDPYGIYFTPDEDSENFVKLCRVLLGVEIVRNPDPLYKLTSDNVKKIMAIHMRFRCNIPVVIMGETGCGKTRLIKFMCTLLERNTKARNLILKKIHGGTTFKDILKTLHKAEERARYNTKTHKIQTVLFFDEANTTEAIGLIKEIMCDGRAMGKPVDTSGGALKIIAACNPYRRHTPEMIQHLTSAGLGYHQSAEETQDTIGSIPLRELVYRVQPLPASMLDLVWDFGRLSADTERQYIEQMIKHQIDLGDLKASSEEAKVLLSILYESQKFMKDQQNECSFVSLRDVERCLRVLVWFLGKMGVIEPLLNTSPTYQPINIMTRAIILAVGVCYHASLQKDRERYRQMIATAFRRPCNLPGRGDERISEEISRCQEAFLNELQLDSDIARNQALKENVFMMVVCIELRIPLFLVGKPGSSKSLAKTVVADAMRGSASDSHLFRQMKRIQLISFQCSPQATPEGITGTFNQAAKLQKHTNLAEFTSVVVLDEVGLAEGSPKMPLKTLHPLLETGSAEDDDNDSASDKHKKVSFIGISNWALDPAKMNRGILLSREEPNDTELVNTATGIFRSDETVFPILNATGIVEGLTAGYKQVYSEQETEYFGLRDFYSLIKMITGFCRRSRKLPTMREVEHAVRRNFDQHGSDAQWDIFRRTLRVHLSVVLETQAATNNPDCSPTGLLYESLRWTTESSVETRYLLLETENYAALPILLEQFLGGQQVKPIFGSSFPYDQEYAQVCRNINRIKLCMETGRSVILLNLENLYESLYDVLNQYYTHYNGQCYVDLGLGTHRVKCRVHKDFRLIVIANSDKVRESFPTPLLNRLEKHYLATSSLLSDEQMQIVAKVEEWVIYFVTIMDPKCRRNPAISSAIVGYHEDAVESLVFQECLSFPQNEADDIEEWTQRITKRVKDSLLCCALPDAVMRVRKSRLPMEARPVYQKYFIQQKTNSLAEFVEDLLHCETMYTDGKGLLVQVTTHSELLVFGDKTKFEQECNQPTGSIEICFLHQYDREQHFREDIRNFYHNAAGEKKVLLIQYSESTLNQDLINCAFYCIQDERPVDTLAHVIVVLQLSRVQHHFSGFPGGEWKSIHIDDLHPPSSAKTLDVRTLKGKSKVDTVKDLTHDVFSTLLQFILSKALARIADKTSDPHSMKTRYHILKNAIQSVATSPRQGCRNLVDVLRHRIAALLTEWQDQRGGAMTDQWLVDVALDEKTLQQSGTYGRAVLHTVGELLIPYLSEILAFVDTNCNMAIRGWQDWRKPLWDEILANVELSPFGVNDIIHDGNLRQRVPIATTGFDGEAFQATCPFSWLLKDRLEFLYSQSKEIAESSSVGTGEEHRQKFLQQALETSWANTLARFIDRDHFAEFVEHYSHDFICMTCFPAKEKDAIEATREVLMETARNSEYWTHNIERSPIRAIVSIHLAYHTLLSQLNNYQMLREAYPGRVVLLGQVQKPIDVRALDAIVEELRPQRQDLSDTQHRKNWLTKIQRVRAPIERILETATRDDQGVYSAVRSCLDQHRCFWHKITMLRIYLETVEPQNVAQKVAEQIMKDSVDDSSMKTSKSFNAMRQTILPAIAYTSDRCATAFLLEIITQMSFSGDRLPDQDVIEILVDFATGETGLTWLPWHKALVESTKKQSESRNILSLRSSILQRLLHIKNTDVVERKFMQFLSKATKAQKMPSVFEFCQLFVSHMEAMYHREVTQRAQEAEIDVALEKLRNATRWLQTHGVHSKSPTIDLLEIIAQARFGLTVAINLKFSENITQEDADQNQMKVVDGIRRFCQVTNLEEVQLFLVRTMFARYGFHAIDEATNQHPWMIPTRFMTSTQTKEADHYVIYGQEYQDIRNAVGAAFTTGESYGLQTALQTYLSPQKQMYLQLSLHSEVTTSYMSESRDNRNECVKRVADIIQMSSLPQRAKEVSLQIIRNNLGNAECRPTTLDRNTSKLNYARVCLVVHCMCVLKCCTSNLVKPLQDLLLQPRNMQNKFLPTMPEDYLLEAQQALKEKGKFYTCSKGHVYMIGNCGRAWTTGRCPDCGEKIGGTDHDLVDSNKEAVMVDKSGRGHILGKASSRSAQSAGVAEGRLKPIPNAVLRTLLHATLLGATCIGEPKDLRRLITNHPRNVGQFLWDHFCVDIHQLSTACGKNVEDCMTLVHLVLKSILTADDKANGNYTLTDKTSRKTWETDFAARYITPVTRSMKRQLKAASEQQQNDERFTSNPIVNFLASQPPLPHPRSLANLVTKPHMWQYRPVVSIGSLQQFIRNHQDLPPRSQNGDQQMSLLEEFLAHEPVLRYLKLLPDILKLIKILRRKYNRCINTTEAKQTTIEMAIQRHRDKGIAEAVDAFITAWNKLRRIEEFQQQVLEEYRSVELTLQSSLAYLLPSRRLEGTCAAALVRFLVNRQNEFVRMCRRIRNDSGTTIRRDTSEVTTSDLIAFDTDKDLLPLIYTNAEYRTTPQGVEVAYDLHQLEQQIENKFIRGRTEVKEKVDYFMFREDTLSKTTFQLIRERVKQEKLSEVVQPTHVLADFVHNFPLLCRYLDILDIAIGYLSESEQHHVSIDNSTLISEYLAQMGLYDIDDFRRNFKTQLNCCLKHILDLWIILSVERATARHSNGMTLEDVFGRIDDFFKAEISNEQRKQCETVFEILNVDIIVRELYECIVLMDEDTNDTWRVRDVLYAYIDAKSDDNDDELMTVGQIPEDWMMSNAAAIWQCAADWKLRVRRF